MRAIVTAGLVLGATLIVSGQSGTDGRTQVLLERLFPMGTTFSAKESSPPHYKAYARDASGNRTMVGVAFWTTELEPLERGYDGPIKILVGMTTKGVLTGVAVASHHEPYGYFSIDTKEFVSQFAGKDIRDAFKVGGDIDAVSRASISVTSASRAIRNSARRVARQLLVAPEPSER